MSSGHAPGSSAAEIRSVRPPGGAPGASSSSRPRAARRRCAPRPTARAGGAPAVGVVAADEDDLALVIGQPGELRAEAGAEAGDRSSRRCARRRTAGPCARRRGARPLRAQQDLVRVESRRPTPAATSGPRLIATIFSKFGGCSPSWAIAAPRTPPRRGSQARGCGGARSRSSSRSSGSSGRRRTSSRRGGPARPRTRREGRAASCRDRRLAAPSATLDREIGAGDVSDEQAVAAQHGPRLLAALGVDQQEGRVLGAVAGGVQRADQQRT